MKNTGKRIVAAVLAVIMFFGMVPLESLTGLDFGGLFGVKANAANIIDKHIIDFVTLNDTLHIKSNKGNELERMMGWAKTTVSIYLENGEATAYFMYNSMSTSYLAKLGVRISSEDGKYNKTYKSCYFGGDPKQKIQSDNKIDLYYSWEGNSITLPNYNTDYYLSFFTTGKEDGSYNQFNEITDVERIRVEINYGSISQPQARYYSANYQAVYDPNAVVVPAHTPSVRFQWLEHSVFTNAPADDRIVNAALSGSIFNDDWIGLRYGIYLKPYSDQINGHDTVWQNNNTTYNGYIFAGCTASNLIPNTKYYYAVFARTDSNIFCSEIQSFVTPKVRPYETKIKSVKTVNYRNGELINSNELGVGDSVTVEWDGNLPKYAEWYKMEITHPDGTKEIKDQLKGTKATVRLTEVGEYTFRVRACNTAGESDWTTTTDKAIVHPDVTLTFKVGSEEIGYRTYEAHTLTWNHDLESMPAIPARVGAAFSGWFRTGEETHASVKNIKEDTVLFAGYKDSVFTVRFQDANGKDIGEPQKVSYGEAAVPPAAEDVPVSNGYEFVGWDHSCANIVENLTIRAVINKQNGALPVTIVNDGSPDGTVTAERHPYGYVINCTVRNETLNDARGRVIVAVKSAQGKLLTVTESEAYYIEGNDRGVLTDDPNGDKSGYNSEQIKIVIPIDLESDANGLDARTAEVYAVESFRKSVPVSNAVITSIVDCDPWSKWTTENRSGYPEGDKQERTEYRYQVLQTTWTNFLSEKNALVTQGWTYHGINANDPRIVTGNWSRTKPKNLEYRVIEEKTVDDYTPTLYYQYKRYRYYNNGWWFSYGSTLATNNGYYGEWQYKRTTSQLPCWNNFDGINAYGSQSDSWFLGGSNTGQGAEEYRTDTIMINVKNGSHKEYRSVDTIYTYNLNKWSEWSEWSSQAPVLDMPANKIIEKDTEIPLDALEREGKEGVIQTRKFYRYKDNQIIITPTEDPNPAVIDESFCSGNLGAEYAGKQLTLFIYKYNEVSDWTTEYVAQSVVEADGSYTFERGILREKPTVETGDFTVILSMQNSTNSIYLGSIEAPKPEYTVVYKDGVQFGGDTISTQTVIKGSNAAAPVAPAHEGYTFSHWDTRSTDIQGDTVINAVYTRNDYVVIFYDAQKNGGNGQIEYMLIPHGATLRVDREISAVESNDNVFYCPYVPESAELEFVQWDLIDPVRTVDPETNTEVIASEEITVTSDLVLTALYAPRTYEVTFMDLDEQSTPPTGAKGTRAAAEESQIGEMHAVKVQEVQYGETLSRTESFVDDIDFGEDVMLFGWSAQDDDTLIDFDTYTITQNTCLMPCYTFFETVETPTASVATGSYTSTQTVTLASETENALIYYTLDGTDPATSDTAVEYSQPVAVNVSCVLRAVACKFNCNDSEEATWVYAINDGSAPAQHVVTYSASDYDAPLMQFLANEGELLDMAMLPEDEGFSFDNAYRSMQESDDDEEEPIYSNPWNYATDTVTEDVTLYLNYVANTYTVTFLDYDGFILDEQEIAYGDAAQAPDDPFREGYVFTGWDTDEYEIVTEDLDVTATYVAESEYVRVTLNRTKYMATQGTSFRLTPTVIGNIENPVLIWSSSDDEVAVVDNNGNVTVTGKGAADITVQILGSMERAVCKLTALPDPNTELMLRSNSHLTMDASGFIRGFIVYTDSMMNHVAPTVAEVRNEFANSDLTFERADGTVLTDDDLIGTGTVIRLMEGETSCDSVTVIIAGDLDGNGVISTRDASLIMQAIVNKIVLTELQIAAADVNGDGIVNNRDASMISRYLVGKETL